MQPISAARIAVHLELDCMAGSADVTRQRQRLLAEFDASEHWHAWWQVYAP